MLSAAKLEKKKEGSHDRGSDGCISMIANIFVGAKHFGSQSLLVLTNKLSAEMLRPCKVEMHHICGTHNLSSRVRCVAPRTSASYIQYFAATHPTDYWTITAVCCSIITILQPAVKTLTNLPITSLIELINVQHNEWYPLEV